VAENAKLVGGRYALVRKIGSGGMGRVWLAHDEILHRDVAVKEIVFPDDLSRAERDELYQRTLREARALGRLNHPNVVAVYDVVLAEGRPWIVMEYVRSRSLYDVIKHAGPLPPRRVAEIGLQVLAALRAAHAAKVWHRDVKPGNILLAEDGRVVLTDFGLATFDGDGSVTRPGLILGSAQYISPERAREGASGPASDLWSLGATLYAAVEGRSPFARETSMATLTALATQPPDPPRRAGPLREVLLGLLRRNPKHRMTAAETERLLRRVINGQPVGRRLPRQRQIQDARSDVTEADALVPAGAETSAGPSTDEPPAGTAFRTITEETFQQPRRRRVWQHLVKIVRRLYGRPRPLPASGTHTATSASGAVKRATAADATARLAQPGDDSAGPSAAAQNASLMAPLTTDVRPRRLQYWWWVAR
jgi:eukaryotic-like serine/threonine-protein kinase